MAIDRDVVVDREPRADGRVVARSADLDGVVDVAADGGDDARARRSPRGVARSPASSRVLAELGRAPVGADLEITSTVPIGGGLVVERGVRGRGRARRCATSAGFALDADSTSRSPRNAPSTSRPACRAASRTSWRRCSAGPATRSSSTAGRSRSSRSRSRPICACSSCTPASRARSKAARTRSGAPRASRSGASSACRALRDATLDQVRDEPRGRHAVTEMVRVRGVRRRAARRRRRRARSADAREPRVVARRHGGVDARARHAGRVPRRRGRVRRAPHRRGLRRLRRRARARWASRRDRRRRRPRRTGSAPSLDPTAWIVHAAAGAGPA